MKNLSTGRTLFQQSNEPLRFSQGDILELGNLRWAAADLYRYNLLARMVGQVVVGYLVEGLELDAVVGHDVRRQPLQHQ